MTDNYVTKTYLTSQFQNYSEVLKEKFVMKGEAGDLSGNDLLDEDVTFVDQMGGIDANTTFQLEHLLMFLFHAQGMIYIYPYSLFQNFHLLKCLLQKLHI